MTSTSPASCGGAGCDEPALLHDSARASPQPQYSALDKFHALVDEINDILGPSSGIDSADVDVEELKRAMAEYDSEEAEWTRYAFADNSRAYTRNLVDRGNGKSNLLILVWSPGRASPIHDHANAHCVMKILKGSLTETLYAWPCQHGGSSNAGECTHAPDESHPSTQHTCSSWAEIMGPTELAVRRETTYTENQVTYMSDRLGLHRVANASKVNGDFAVSLHLYTPPNAARFGCHIFDPKTGKRSHAKQCHFFSELGNKMQQ